MTFFLSAFFMMPLVHSADFASVVTCKLGPERIDVEFSSEEKPIRATVTLWRKAIPVNDCSESVGNSIVCKSNVVDDPECPNGAYNRLHLSQGGDGGAIFERETCTDHTTLVFDECVRVYKEL